MVEALRRHRDEGWPIPTPRKRRRQEQPLDVEQYIGGAYGDLFRLGSDMSGMDDFYIEREEGTFGSLSADTLVQDPDESYVQRVSFTETATVIADADVPADCLPPESTDDELTHHVQAELRMRCGRQRGQVIDGLRVHVAGDMVRIICATFADLEIVQRELIGALQHILGRLGAPPQLVFTTRAGLEFRSVAPGNARSRSDVEQGVASLT